MPFKNKEKPKGCQNLNKIHRSSSEWLATSKQKFGKNVFYLDFTLEIMLGKFTDMESQKKKSATENI